MDSNAPILLPIQQTFPVFLFTFCGVLNCLQIMTSFANSWVVEDFFKKLCTSLMNMKHSSGPRTLPLGTPEVTSDVCYCCCFIVYGLVGFCLLEKMRSNWYRWCQFMNQQLVRDFVSGLGEMRQNGISLDVLVKAQPNIIVIWNHSQLVTVDLFFPNPCWCWACEGSVVVIVVVH